ncbi:MAG TPA: glycosyltransferase family 1 protein [Steroidobacteraceae bacterium]|jgi:glycosyltransferase involved in cell wall biosynthesis
MKILIVTDAWRPQTNGVVSTLSHTVDCLRGFGHDVNLITPEGFRTVACPSYPEIRLALFAGARVARSIEAFAPAALHIATEGSLGHAARRYCLRRGLNFTTSYHTQFPQYLRSRAPIPLSVTYRWLRHFHAAGRACMVSTRSMQVELERRGFRNVVRWQRGVNTQLFRPGLKHFLDLPRPIAVYLGRVAVEKNIDAFLGMPWSGTRLVIGDGPERARLQASYPHTVFAGYRFGEDLVAHLAACDVFVFPSRTDTFGLVNLEAMACGLPVAAYPVTGPIDVVEDGVTGALDADLGRAAQRALLLDPAACRARALRSSWERCTREFAANLTALQRSGQALSQIVQRSPHGGQQAAATVEDQVQHPRPS